MDSKPFGLVAANATDLTGGDSPDPPQIKREVMVQLENTQPSDPFTPTPTLAATGNFADFRDSTISAFELEESEMRRKVETYISKHDSSEANSCDSIGRIRLLQQRLRFVGYT